MFTGLITGVGIVREVQPIGGGKDARFVIATPDNADWAEAEIKLGASIACSGCCLTVVEFGPGWFAVEVSAESLSLTTLGAWKQGSQVNLEGSLRLGAELGGHIVSGHVDGLAEVTSITPENGSTRWKFRLPPDLSKFVAPKGSIAINGVSLTVNEVEDTKTGANATEFGVNIIPHTIAHTNFATVAVGDRVNIEIDMLARYVARQLQFQHA
jgi:riboflavin synthase